ncbi:MAG TPA: tetratricopeptide repeat protein [Steroidobacteraceae bacterium]|nr:tetratricopeptide repeat protein [Steroidobacteraceae bacterium]
MRLARGCAAVAAAAIFVNAASGQVIPGTRPSQVPGGTTLPMPDEAPATSSPEKSDKAANKAFKEGMKALDKAKELEAAAATAPNPDKKAKAMEKLGDEYNKALDEFTEALSNKADMVEAWNQVGYVHLRLGAFREALDDYNHALALKPDLLDAVEHRAEANLAVDRLDEVKIAYMDLFNHAPASAAQLMAAMQKWLAVHQSDPSGMRASDVDAFSKWLAERDGIAKQTASAQ